MNRCQRCGKQVLIQGERQEFCGSCYLHSLDSDNREKVLALMIQSYSDGLLEGEKV